MLAGSHLPVVCNGVVAACVRFVGTPGCMPAVVGAVVGGSRIGLVAKEKLRFRRTFVSLW